MINDKDEDEKKRAEEAIEEIFKLTVRLGGTLSGEHGVGITKAPYVHMELSRDAIEVMKKIKRVLDPNNILNPGKIFDAPHPLPLPQGEREGVRGKIFKT
jgi:glycolate oxidase